MRTGTKEAGMKLRRIGLERGRRSAPVITVAGSPQTQIWLSAIARQAGMPWRIKPLEEKPRGVLVLTQPEEHETLLKHWTGLRRVVVSLDCPEGRSLALSEKVETFSFSEGRDCADLTAKELRRSEEGLRFVAVTKNGLARVCVDEDDLYPALSTLACAVWMGVPLKTAADMISVPAEKQNGKWVKMA